MDNITEYIDVLIQAPVAVITMFFIWLMFKLLISFLSKMADTQNKIVQEITNSLDEAIKIIKQQERKP